MLTKDSIIIHGSIIISKNLRLDFSCNYEDGEFFFYDLGLNSHKLVSRLSGIIETEYLPELREYVRKEAANAKELKGDE